MQIVRLKAGGTEAFDTFIAEGLAPVADANRPGMHGTASTDFGLVLSGQLILELEDGTEIMLTPGDVVVQNGTRHRWVNRGHTDAVWAAFIVGAEHPEAPTF
jgi:quercetin dioxygenase-like cupin family protein